MQYQVSGNAIIVPYSAGALIHDTPRFSYDIGSGWAYTPTISKVKKTHDYTVVATATDSITISAVPSKTNSYDGLKTWNYSAYVCQLPDEIQPVDISDAISNCPATINLHFVNHFVNVHLTGNTVTQLDGSGYIEGYFSDNMFCAKTSSEAWTVEAAAWISSDDAKTYFKLNYKTAINNSTSCEIIIYRGSGSEICCNLSSQGSSTLRTYGAIIDSTTPVHYVIGDFPMNNAKRYHYLYVDDNTSAEIRRALNNLDSVYCRT